MSALREPEWGQFHLLMSACEHANGLCCSLFLKIWLFEGKCTFVGWCIRAECFQQICLHMLYVYMFSITAQKQHCFSNTLWANSPSILSRSLEKNGYICIWKHVWVTLPSNSLYLSIMVMLGSISLSTQPLSALLLVTWKTADVVAPLYFWFKTPSTPQDCP